jgi:hypothetical protein
VRVKHKALGFVDSVVNNRPDFSGTFLTHRSRDRQAAEANPTNKLGADTIT